MPRVKPMDPSEQRRRKFRSIVTRYIELYDYGDEKIAALWGVCTKTVQNRMKEPDKITVDQMRKLCHALHFTDEDRLAIMKL